MEILDQGHLHPKLEVPGLGYPRNGKKFQFEPKQSETKSVSVVFRFFS